MKEIIDEILDYADDDNASRSIMQSLYYKLEDFAIHSDQATELVDLSVDFPKNMNDKKLRAWLILAYDNEYGEIPNRDAVDTAMIAIRAIEQYWNEFYKWKNEQKKGSKIAEK